MPIDYLFGAIGGGGFISGVSSLFRQLSPETKIIGVEPTGAASMYQSLQAGVPTQFQNLDPFVDGAAVGKPGDLTLDICK